MHNIKRVDMYCLFAIGLMWVWPFIYPLHQFPIATFYQEWSAVLLGFSAGLLILLKNDFWQSAQVPRIVLLPLGLALVVYVQSELGMLLYFEQTMLVLLYLLWSSLLIVVGYYLRQRVGLPLLAIVLAFCLLLGSEISSLIGILQYFKWHTLLDPWLMPRLSKAVYGNIGQPNHFANYVMLGVISLLYLNSKKKIANLAALACCLPLLLVLALSGSRSSWFYLIAMAALSYFFYKRDQLSAPPFIRVAGIMAGLLLINGLLLIPFLSGGGLDSLTPLERMYSAVNSAGSVSGSAYGGSIRLYLWHEASLMFLHAPWLGIGFGQYTWQHFQMLPTLKMTQIQGLYNNAHNLFFQLAAETGLAGLTVLFGTLIPWLRRTRRASVSLEAWWGYGILSVLFIHSMLEYPFWYAYFIGIAAFLLGMFEQSAFQLRLPMLYRVPVTIVLIFGLASIQQMYANFRLLENIISTRPASANDADYLARIWTVLAKVQSESIFRPYAELFMGVTMEAVPAPLETKLPLFQRTVMFSPNANVVYRYALMLAEADKLDEANLQIERSIWSYPDEFGAFRVKLAALAQTAPTKFEPLLKYADLINARYQSVR
jgi:O-antigen ligase